eukprot:gene19975-20497_t
MGFGASAKHFAQFDKSEFMALVESVMRDLDGTSATGQLEDLMITSTDQSQEGLLLIASEQQGAVKAVDGRSRRCADDFSVPEDNVRL